MEPSSYTVDPDDPRAPPQALWERMTDEQRRQILDTLPSETPRATPPEGDQHTLPKERSKLTLKEYFRRRGRSVYLGSELPVYYPDESMFAPDLLAVLDVEDHPRDHWVVSHEGRGLDLALEIHVKGDRRKDYETNVARFARLAIPEYFVFDPPAHRLLGYRLAEGAASYEPVVPQSGLWRSAVLGLDLSLEGGRLQFNEPGGGVLLDPSEWIDRLRIMVDEAVERAEDEARRVERLEAKLRELGVDPDDL